MTVYGLKCSQCGKEKHEPAYPNFYICCGKVLCCYCPTCQRMYYKPCVIKNRDLYLCAECGQPHYGYTAWKQSQ